MLIKDIRSRYGTQSDFAAQLSVSQVLVSQWESGSKSPGYWSLLKLSKLGKISSSERDFFLRKLNETALAKANRLAEFMQDSGQPGKSEIEEADQTSVVVPIFSNPSALMLGWRAAFRDRSGIIRIPKWMLGEETLKDIAAIHSPDDSMAPIFYEGDLVIFSCGRWRTDLLEGKIVCALNTDHGDLIVGWLRKSGGHFFLVREGHLVALSDDWNILGRTLCWIGRQK